MDRKASISINNFDNHMVIRMNDESNLIDHVPAMVYKASIGRAGIIMIKDRPNFSLPQLRFGKHNARIKQITASYDRHGKSNGVLLHGLKGSGKSLLAEELGNWMIAQDLPVIMVNEPMGAEELSIIIKAVGPCMVYFDEFGKIYTEKNERERLLPLFSDTSLVGVMFVVTGNEADEFSDYLVFRPQRFRYNIGFTHGIDRATMEDILTKMQVAPVLHKAFHAYAQENPGKLNFDSLLCVIRESAGCKDAIEVADVCEILNVPSFPRMVWHISKVEVLDEGGEEFEGFGFQFLSQHHDASECTVMISEKRRHNGTMWSLTRDGGDPLAKECRKLVSELDIEKGTHTFEYQGHKSFRITLTYGFEKRTTTASREPTATYESGNGQPSVRGMGRVHSEGTIDHSQPIGSGAMLSSKHAGNQLN